jgi:hypothetical protein
MILVYSDTGRIQDTCINTHTHTHTYIYIYIYIQGAAFNVTNFESRITHLLYTATNTTEHG